MTITYQQAKRIRKTGLMSLFADQLMYEKKVSTAIKKTISLKTRGTIKGITEKFDPLNIVKKLTFGSKWAPALYGHFAKRDPRDIQYFTGRLKPIRERTGTGDKLTKLSRTMDIGGGNISPVLLKMYKLLANTHEQNVKRLELDKNREEERQLLEEKRHKELLEALGHPKSGKTKFLSKSKVAAESMYDKFKNFLERFDFTKILSKFMGGAKAFGSLLKFLGSNIFRMVLMNPAVLTVASILALAELLAWGVKKVVNRNVISPEEAAAALENASDYDIEKLGGEEKLKDIIMNGPARAAEILNRNDEVEINQAGGREFLEKVVKQTGLKVPTRQGTTTSNVPPRPTKGGLGLPKQQEKWDKLYGGKFDPITGKPLDNSFDIAEMAKLERQAATAKGVPIGGTNELTQKLDETQNENLKNKISLGATKGKGTTTVNNTSVNQQPNKTIPLKRNMPAVRNNELEFQNRMISNTRVAN